MNGTMSSSATEVGAKKAGGSAQLGHLGHRQPQTGQTELLQQRAPRLVATRHGRFLAQIVVDRRYVSTRRQAWRRRQLSALPGRGRRPLAYNSARLRLLFIVLVLLLLLAGCALGPRRRQRSSRPTKSGAASAPGPDAVTSSSRRFRSRDGSGGCSGRRGTTAAAGSGSLRVAALSADSGREIAEITDVRGTDHDTKYLSDLPRRYYLVVTSDRCGLVAGCGRTSAAE